MIQDEQRLWCNFCLASRSTYWYSSARGTNIMCIFAGEFKGMQWLSRKAIGSFPWSSIRLVFFLTSKMAAITKTTFVPSSTERVLWLRVSTGCHRSLTKATKSSLLIAIIIWHPPNLTLELDSWLSNIAHWYPSPRLKQRQEYIFKENHFS